jgi:hypothetical protein
MGLDYRYRLYFKREALWGALQGVVAIAQPAQKCCKVVFPDYTIILQLEPWYQPEGTFHYNDPEFRFLLVIYFPPDREIGRYFQSNSPKHMESWSRKSPLGLPIGFIYLTVYNDLNAFERKDWDPDLVMLEFGTPGSSMSILFYESDSIRLRFQNILEENQGICGILDMEDSARVIWLNGQRVDERISNPTLSPEEISMLLSGPSTNP